MQLDRYTVKSQEALERAQRIARDRSHQELQPEHLLAALLEEPEGTVAAVLSKLGVPRDKLVARGRPMRSTALPRVPAASMYLGDGAARRARPRRGPRRRGSRTSTSASSTCYGARADARNTGAVAQRCSTKAGVSREALLKALATVRGGQRVTDASPEDKYQALDQVRPRPHRGGAAGQARSRDRARRRDPSRRSRCWRGAPRTTRC